MTKNKDSIHRPRRARMRWYGQWPLWLKAAFVVLVIILVSIIGWQLAPKQRHVAAVTPAPNPTSTWTTYIPEMPIECADMLDAADALYDTSTNNEQQLLELAQLAVDGAQQKSPAKLIAAGKAAEKAHALTPKLKAVRTKFLDAYRKCAEA